MVGGTCGIVGEIAVHEEEITGHLGRGACGGLEAWMTVEMLKRGWFAPTINLDNIDPDCADLDYIVGDGRTGQPEFVMTNNFAFGGVNTSLIIRRWD